MANNGIAVDGKAIRDARLRKGWTLRDLMDACEAAGRKVDFSLLAAYERGLTRPTPRSLFALAKALDLTVDDLRDKSEAAA